MKRGTMATSELGREEMAVEVLSLQEFFSQKKGIQMDALRSKERILFRTG